jgi:hypothetical protein
MNKMEDIPTGTQLKPVHANVWSPHNALFKSSRKDRAEVQVILCGRSEDCGLLARGECSWRASFDWHACPYGMHRKFEGYTPRARAYSRWIKEQKEKYTGVPFLNSHSDVLAFVGDYVFLPYAHMDMSDAGFLKKNEGWLGKGNAFLPKEKFTVNNILYLIHFRPRAAWGGQEIKDYQEKSVPKFVKHLQEKCPDLFKEIIEKDPTVQKILNTYTNKGRKAILQTITPNIGKFIDCHKAEWIWDGEYFTTLKYNGLTMIVKAEEVRIKPLPKQEIVITDDNQVNDKTEFLS